MDSGPVIVAAVLVSGVLLLWRPIWLVYVQLMIAPIDAVLVFGSRGPIAVSLADVITIALLCAVIFRPGRILSVPGWYALALAVVLVSAGLAALASPTDDIFGSFRALASKILCGFAIVVLISNFEQLQRALVMLCVGIFASVCLGAMQEVAYLRGGWLAATAWGAEGAVFAPVRGLTPMPLRVPGGTQHAAYLGIIAAVPLGLMVGQIMGKHRIRLHYTAALVLTGVVGFLISEGRATVLGLAASVTGLLLLQSLRQRSVLKMGLLAYACAAVAPIALALRLADYDSRSRVIYEMTSRGNALIIGMGPGEFERSSALGLNVHSTPLQLLSDTGILGLAGYLIIIGISFKRLWRGAAHPALLPLLGAALAYYAPALLFHPVAGMREHWLILALAVVAPIHVAGATRHSKNTLDAETATVMEPSTG